MIPTQFLGNFGTFILVALVFGLSHFSESFMWQHYFYIVCFVSILCVCNKTVEQSAIFTLIGLQLIPIWLLFC